jgi:hypothetical protein
VKQRPSPKRCDEGRRRSLRKSFRGRPDGCCSILS